MNKKTKKLIKQLAKIRRKRALLYKKMLIEVEIEAFYPTQKEKDSSVLMIALLRA